MTSLAGEGATGSGQGGLPGAGQAEWFTVAEAAELLEVNSSRIFDGIRDGNLRVRFRAATPGAGERPLVSSDDLCRRSQERKLAEKAAENAGGADSAQALPGPSPAEPFSAASADSDLNPAAPSAMAAAGVVPRTEPSIGPDTGSSTTLAGLREVDPDGAPASAAKEISTAKSASSSEEPEAAPAPGGPSGEAGTQEESPETATRGEETQEKETQEKGGKIARKTTSRKGKDSSGDRDRAQEIEDLRDAQREARRSLDREARRVRELEAKLEEWAEEREEQQRSRTSLVGQLQDKSRRASDLERDLVAARRQIELAEDRIEASLKAVYERDVEVARLGSQLEASSQVRTAGDGYAQQLQDRLTRVEDRSEEKEHEIRRLALGLGEARGEIRLLRPPPVEGGMPARFRLRWPWIGVGVLALLIAWVVGAMGSSGQVYSAAFFGATGVILAFLWGRRRASSLNDR